MEDGVGGGFDWVWVRVVVIRVSMECTPLAVSSTHTSIEPLRVKVDRFYQTRINRPLFLIVDMPDGDVQGCHVTSGPSDAITAWRASRTPARRANVLERLTNQDRATQLNFGATPHELSSAVCDGNSTVFRFRNGFPRCSAA